MSVLFMVLNDTGGSAGPVARGLADHPAVSSCSGGSATSIRLGQDTSCQVVLYFSGVNPE